MHNVFFTLTKLGISRRFSNAFAWKIAKPPLDPKTKLKKNVNKDDEMVKVLYQQVVGSLMYAMSCTQPDLTYPISVVSQHMANPSLEHLTVVKCIFRYLQGTLEFKLHFEGSPPQDFVGYCDADWVGDLEDRRSTIGFVFIMGGGGISWSSKRQPTIALSTTEAKYMASTQATKEAIWMTKVMKELEYMKEKKAMVIRCDNQGAISFTKNPTQHVRTKHINVQHHFVQKRVESGEVTFEYCLMEDMVADVLTKALSKKQHNKLITMFRLKTS